MRFVPIALALCISLHAQGYLSAWVQPPVVPQSQPVTIDLYNASQTTVVLPTWCFVAAIRFGSPSGPATATPNCPPFATPVTLAPCQSISYTLGTTGLVAPGDYFFQVVFTTPAGTQTEFFPFHINYGPVTLLPAYNTGFDARVGFSRPLEILAGVAPSCFYAVAASMSTNSGIPIGPGLSLTLDNDVLFGLSFPAPNAALFTNFQGLLTPSGTAFNISVNIPPIPQLACLPLNLQAAVLTQGGSILLSNTLSYSILP